MRMFSSKVLIKALLLVVVPTTSAIMLAQSPKTPTDSGTISGVRESGLSVYKGVPFAAPPVGDLRWRPPVPVTPWAGTRKTDAFAPGCMQIGVSMPGETLSNLSEDCLYLNIWTPAKSAHERMPVIVCIYGGGHQWVGLDAPVRGRPTRAQRHDRCHHRVSTRSPRLSCASRADTRVTAPLLRQLRPDGPDCRSQMDSEEHCGLWRRPEECNDRRSILRSNICQHFDGISAGQRLVSARHRGERWSL